MQRCVIIGGAEIKNYNRIKSKLNENDYFIFCDSGLKHQKMLNINANLIIGDFDSISKPETNVETVVLPTVKDDTDTFYAVKEAIKRGFNKFLLIGVTGNRLDHTLGNISALLYLYKQEKTATVIDDYSVMQIVGKEPISIEKAKYFSLLNISGTATGVNIENAKYPLNDAQINSEYSYCISNELIKNQKAKVYVKNGQMLLIIVEEED
ncbi:MAG: thiamine diphosphokinase [Clostridiales bacterium]|nr:thiamine diphosphokinase [Clostridiales bacterium]